MFMLGEFIEIAIVAALFVTLFLGGPNLPYMSDAGFAFPGGATLALGHGTVVALQLVGFLFKVFVMCSFQILVRWTLPRFRWDQLLVFAWRFLLPLAIVNLAVTALAVWQIG
jgi:NADH-quinone oxidoreductase subunit H